MKRTYCWPQRWRQRRSRPLRMQRRAPWIQGLGVKKASPENVAKKVILGGLGKMVNAEIPGGMVSAENVASAAKKVIPALVVSAVIRASPESRGCRVKKATRESQVSAEKKEIKGRAGSPGKKETLENVVQFLGMSGSARCFGSSARMENGASLSISGGSMGRADLVEVLDRHLAPILHCLLVEQQAKFWLSQAI